MPNHYNRRHLGSMTVKPPAMSDLRFLGGYPEHLLQQVRQLLAKGELGPRLEKRYGTTRHEVQSDKALYDYVMALKNRYMKSSAPLSRIGYDSKINIIKHALGLHTHHSRVQGGKLKAKSQIQIAALFREAPEPFLRMIVVHELAHLKEKEHDKAFYSLCCHMEPDYHQLEFDLRLWLTAREQPAAVAEPSQGHQIP